MTPTSSRLLRAINKGKVIDWRDTNPYKQGNALARRRAKDGPIHFPVKGFSFTILIV